MRPRQERAGAQVEPRSANLTHLRSRRLSNDQQALSIIQLLISENRCSFACRCVVSCVSELGHELRTTHTAVDVTLIHIQKKEEGQRVRARQEEENTTCGAEKEEAIKNVFNTTFRGW